MATNNPFLDSLKTQGFALDVPGENADGTPAAAPAANADPRIPLNPTSTGSSDYQPLYAPAPKVADNPFMQVANDYGATNFAQNEQNELDASNATVNHTLNPGFWSDLKNGFLNLGNTAKQIVQNPMAAAQGTVLGLLDAGPAVINTAVSILSKITGLPVSEYATLPSDSLAPFMGYGKSQSTQDVQQAFTTAGTQFSGYEMGGAAARGILGLPVGGLTPGTSYPFGVLGDGGTLASRLGGTTAIATKVLGNVLGGQITIDPDASGKQRANQALFDGLFGVAQEGASLAGSFIKDGKTPTAIPPEVAATIPSSIDTSNLTEVPPRANPLATADQALADGKIEYQPKKFIGYDSNGQPILATTHFDYATGNAVVEYKASLDNAGNEALRSAVMDHEHGHIIDNRINGGTNLSSELPNPVDNMHTLSRVLTNLASDMNMSVTEVATNLHEDIQKLSGGAQENESEAFAEAFRKYKADPEAAKEEAPTFSKFMSQESNPRFTERNTTVADVANDNAPALRDEYNKQSTVEVNGKKLTLTGKANEEYVKAREEYRQQVKSMNDFAKTNPEETSQIWTKMKNDFDAKTREITGKYNPKEISSILDEEKMNYPGKRVTIELDGRPVQGEIKGKPKNGMYTVKLDDGTIIKNIGQNELRDPRTTSDIIADRTARKGVTENETADTSKPKEKEAVKAPDKNPAKARAGKVELEPGAHSVEDTNAALKKAGYSDAEISKMGDTLPVKNNMVDASDTLNAAEDADRAKALKATEPKAPRSVISDEARQAQAEASEARAKASEARAEATKVKSAASEARAKAAEAKATASEARASASQARAEAASARASAREAKANAQANGFKNDSKFDTGKRVSGQPNFNDDTINVSSDTKNLLDQLTKEQSLTDKSVSKSNDDLKAGASTINMTPKQVIDMNPGTSGFSETALKTRQLWLNKIDDLANWIKGVSKNSMTADQALELRTRTNEINAIWMTMRGFGTEASNTLRSFGIKLSPGENATMAQLMGDLKELDPENPVKFREGVGDNLQETPTQAAGRKAFAVWYQAILSGPKTAARNFLGNTFNLMTQIASKLTNPATMKEFIPSVQAFVHGFIEQTPEFVRDFKNAILGKDVGVQDSKLLESTDPFDKSVWGTSKAAKLGHWFEGLGKVMLSDKYIAKVSSDVEKASMKVYSPEVSDELNNAMSNYFAEKTVFHGEPGGRMMNAVKDSAENLRRKFPPAKIILPFVKTVSNIIDQQLDYMPIISHIRAYQGDFIDRQVDEMQKLTGYTFENDAEKELIRNRLKDYAVGKAFFGTAIAGAAIPFAMQGLISGSGPSNYQEREQLQRTGWRPNSIRVGDTWFPYSNLGPLSGLLSMAGNIHDASKYDKDASGVASAIGGGMLGWMQSQLSSSFMQGAAKLLDAINNKNAAYFTQTLPESLIPTPALITQTHDLIATQQYDAQGFTQSMRDKLGLEGSAFGLNPLPERLDAFGQPMKSDMIYGLTPSRQKADLVDQYLVGKDIVVPIPVENQKYSIPYSKEKAALTQQEYHDYVETSGKEIYTQLQQSIPAIQSMSDDDQKKYVQSLVDRIRTSTRNRILLSRKK